MLENMHVQHQELCFRRGYIGQRCTKREIEIGTVNIHIKTVEAEMKAPVGGMAKIPLHMRPEQFQCPPTGFFREIDINISELTKLRDGIKTRNFQPLQVHGGKSPAPKKGGELFNGRPLPPMDIGNLVDMGQGGIFQRQRNRNAFRKFLDSRPYQRAHALPMRHLPDRIPVCVGEV